MEKPNGKFKVLVTDHLPHIGWELLQAADDIITAGPITTEAELMKEIVDSDAIIIRSATKVNAALMDAAKQLKIIARAGAQINNIEIEEATNRGIMVVNVPDGNRYAIVEHTFGMMLSLARKIPYGVSTLRGGEWLRHKITGFQLYGKTLGLIGYGRIGQDLAARGQAFGMKVIAYDPLANIYLAYQKNVEVVEFEDLLQRSDILTLQIAMTENTANMMDADAFALMKPEAYLVNCIHAGLVDESALLAALENEEIAGAAIDTYIDEPISPGHPFPNHDKILATPHLNQNTIESQNETGSSVVEDVLDVLRGTDYRNVTNLPFTEKTSYLSTKQHVLLGTKLGIIQGQLSKGKITRLEVELIGDDFNDYIRAATTGLLTGLLRKHADHEVNWVSAPVSAYELGIQTAQVKNLLHLPNYPSLLACKVYWEGEEARLVAGALHASGEARIISYNGFSIDAIPEGVVLILENLDTPGVIGNVGSSLGEAGINISNWSYGREVIGGQAISFINLDGLPDKALLATLESRPEIIHARVVQF